MKTTSFKNLSALMAIGGMAISASMALAQDSSATYTTQAAPATAIGYGVTQVVQLQQAKVGDDTIIAYIKNSGNSYGLNADQIIYLRQQGVSTAVINTMLSQPTTGLVATAPAASTQAAPPPATYYSQPVSSPSIVGPSVTAIDPTAAAAANYYYYQPYYYPSYYPVYGYGYYPSVSLSFGWRGGWGGGFHGGGFHGGGGGFHGGWHH